MWLFMWLQSHDRNLTLPVISGWNALALSVYNNIGIFIHNFNEYKDDCLSCAGMQSGVHIYYLSSAVNGELVSRAKIKD